MPINRKALYASLLVSLPAPLILALIPMNANIELYLEQSGFLVDYLLAYALFVIVALVASGLAIRTAGGQQEQAAQGKRSARKKGKDTEEGTVKWFNVKKGFGFITRDSGGDVFVHFRAIQGEGRRVLRQGQRVSYTVVEAEKGLQANDVTTLDDE
ncbi:cold shock domain-containing protein [Salicola sp. Rm-C-2C1-2]|uniref:cold-shock protein n=1 Tax=Salicola sp. Rm-C-2C1-2 TaxID=3141321 RepID=UPI0032E3903A